MPELPPYPSTDDDTGVAADCGSATSNSRWVYAFWIIGIGLIVLVVVLHLTGTVGPHGH